MKMERVIQGTLGVLAATAVFGVAAQTASQTQPKSSITTSSSAATGAGGAMDSSVQRGENATRMSHPPTGTGAASSTPDHTRSTPNNMNMGSAEHGNGSMNRMGGSTQQGGAMDSSVRRGENATRMQHPPTGAGAASGTPDYTRSTPNNMNMGSEEHGSGSMNKSGDRMQRNGNSSSGMSQGTADRAHGETRTSGSEGGENVTRMPHPPTGTGAAIGVPGQPGSTMSSGGEGNRAGTAKPQ